MAKCSEPSEFSRTFTSAIPSRGAATIPSVMIASAVLIDCSAASSFPISPNFPVTISLAILKEAISLPTSSSSSLSLSLTPSGPTKPSTLIAIFSATGISGSKLGSLPLDLASLATS